MSQRSALKGSREWDLTIKGVGMSRIRENGLPRVIAIFARFSLIQQIVLLLRLQDELIGYRLLLLGRELIHELFF